MKITVVGIGYVGLSLATLISHKYQVELLDIDKEKIDLVNKRRTPINDIEIAKCFKEKNLFLSASFASKKIYKNSEFIIIATPTNYDEKSGFFDTETVENVINDIASSNTNGTIVIKSTIPVGFTEKIKKRYPELKIFFCPEFLRENMALYDNFYPLRIVIGDDSNEAIKFGEILIKCSKKKKKDIPILIMNSSEAESVKLFSNTYLAMRVAFFNELDSFSESNKLDTKKIIEGVSLDNRVGNFYNNPSFGYGGYCLPKDSKQLLANYKNIPNKIITAVVESNKTRKEFIVNSILSRSPKIVGIYRLIMKKDSDNFRESAIVDIIDMLIKNEINIIIYEPLIKNSDLYEVNIIDELDEFVKKSDLILANRMTRELAKHKNKVYSRDLFREN